MSIQVISACIRSLVFQILTFENADFVILAGDTHVLLLSLPYTNEIKL